MVRCWSKEPNAGEAARIERGVDRWFDACRLVVQVSLTGVRAHQLESCGWTREPIALQ